MKILRLIGICVGISLAVYLVHQVGWTSVKETLGLLGASYVLVLVYPMIWMGFNTVGWSLACRPDLLKASLFRLAQIRVAGEAFNDLLPSSYVGGEPLKAKLLAESMPLREATSSVLIAKSAQSVGMVIYVGLGLTLSQATEGSAFEHAAPWMALGLLTIGIGIFTTLLARRSFSRLGHLLHRLTHWDWLKRQEARLMALDESLGYFYREGKLRFAASVLWHTAGWMTGAAELLMLFFLIHHPLNWRQAWFMGALAQLGSILGLFIPAGLGLYEGGHYMAARILGLPPEWAVSVSLIRRVREVFWDCVGMGLFWSLSQASAATGRELPGNSTGTSSKPRRFDS